MKKKIVVICGGNSSEYEISIKSGENVYDSIDSERYDKYLMTLKGREWSVIQNGKSYPVDKNDFSCTIEGEKVTFDFAYITIHGLPGENGQLQGYLDMMGVPYSTSNLRVEAITFDKYTCTEYLRGMGIDTTEPLLLRRGDHYDIEEILKSIALPCFVKPSGEGSSFGVTRVNRSEELKPAIDEAFSKCSDIVIEEMIEGTEFTCGLYRAGGKMMIFPVAEVVPQKEFFDYEAKYSGKSDEIIPGRFSEEVTEGIQSMAAKVYDILDCRGIIRIDGFVTKDRIIMLEVNTTPGMTEHSFIPQMAKVAGRTLTAVLTDIIEDGLKGS